MSEASDNQATASRSPRRARRRPMIEIAASILKRASAEPLGISKIILFENLSYRDAKKCLERLLRAGLIKTVTNNTSKRYITTSKGLEFVSSLQRAISALEREEKDFSFRA